MRSKQETGLDVFGASKRADQSDEKNLKRKKTAKPRKHHEPPRGEGRRQHSQGAQGLPPRDPGGPGRSRSRRTRSDAGGRQEDPPDGAAPSSGPSSRRSDASRSRPKGRGKTLPPGPSLLSAPGGLGPSSSPSSSWQKADEGGRRDGSYKRMDVNGHKLPMGNIVEPAVASQFVSINKVDLSKLSKVERRAIEREQAMLGRHDRAGGMMKTTTGDLKYTPVAPVETGPPAFHRGGTAKTLGGPAGQQRRRVIDPRHQSTANFSELFSDEEERKQYKARNNPKPPGRRQSLYRKLSGGKTMSGGGSKINSFDKASKKTNDASTNEDTCSSEKKKPGYVKSITTGIGKGVTGGVKAVGKGTSATVSAVGKGTSATAGAVYNGSAVVVKSTANGVGYCANATGKAATNAAKNTTKGAKGAVKMTQTGAAATGKVASKQGTVLKKKVHTMTS